MLLVKWVFFSFNFGRLENESVSREYGRLPGGALWTLSVDCAGLK